MRRSILAVSASQDIGVKTQWDLITLNWPGAILLLDPLSSPVLFGEIERKGTAKGKIKKKHKGDQATNFLDVWRLYVTYQLVATRLKTCAGAYALILIFGHALVIERYLPSSDNLEKRPSHGCTGVLTGRRSLSAPTELKEEVVA